MNFISNQINQMIQRFQSAAGQGPIWYWYCMSIVCTLASIVLAWLWSKPAEQETEYETKGLKIDKTDVARVNPVRVIKGAFGTQVFDQQCDKHGELNFPKQTPNESAHVESRNVREYLVQNSDNLCGKLRAAVLREGNTKKLSNQERRAEEKIRHRQMAEIYAVLKQQDEQNGVQQRDTSDAFKEQLKMYAL